MPDGNSVTATIELYDSDILKIEPVIEKLNERQGQVLNLDAFQREAKERFFNAGFKVDVLVYETNQEGLYWFEIQIEDRIDGKPFDGEKMHHEVTHDILDLGEGGTIPFPGTPD